MSLKLVLEVNDRVVASSVINATIVEVNTRVAIWWKLYALKTKTFRIYYDPKKLQDDATGTSI